MRAQVELQDLEAKLAAMEAVDPREELLAPVSPRLALRLVRAALVVVRSAHGSSHCQLRDGVVAALTGVLR